MQRWIAAGLVAMMLFLGGGYLAYRTYQQNRQHPIWCPIPIRADLEPARTAEIIKSLKEALGAPGLLENVSKDLGLKQKWNLASDDECSKEIVRRLFVDKGELDTPNGKVSVIRVGVKGKVKESGVTNAIAMRLMDDVWKILGIDPPAKKG